MIRGEGTPRRIASAARRARENFSKNFLMSCNTVAVDLPDPTAASARMACLHTVASGDLPFPVAKKGRSFESIQMAACGLRRRVQSR